MQKKRLKVRMDTKIKRGGAQERAYLPEKYWDGVCSRHQIYYLEKGDGEQYPIPEPVGALITDFLQDIARLERVLDSKKIKRIPLLSSRSAVVIKNARRVALRIRFFMHK